MRVAFFLRDLAGSGVTRTTLGYARHWPAEAGDSILVLRNGGGAYVDEAVDIPRVILDLPRDGVRAGALTPLRLAHTAAREGIDVVVSAGTIRTVVAAKSIRRQLRVIWRLPNPLGTMTTGLRGPISRQVWIRTLPRLLHRIDGIVVPVEGFIEDLRVVGWQGPIAVVPPPLGVPYPSAADIHPRKTAGPVRVISVGRLTVQKRFDVLLRAVAIARRSQDITLTVYGEGLDRTALESLRHQLGLDGIVRFPGFTHDARTMYADADVFALSSDFEGFGHVVIEALAWGLPVVATRVPYGPPDILGDGRYGLLVPPRDPKALAEALLDVLPGSRQAQRLGASARDRAREYLPDSITQRLADIALSVAGRSP
jgi:glycosyltransferase involved in cell wall biosynthesis